MWNEWEVWNKGQQDPPSAVRTEGHKGANGSRYQSIYELTVTLHYTLLHDINDTRKVDHTRGGGGNFPYSFQTVVWALFYVPLDLTNETDEEDKAANGLNCQTTLMFVCMINISYNVKGQKLIKMFNK